MEEPVGTIATAIKWVGSPIGTAIGAAAGAYFVYRLGLRAYFLQKEHDNVRERYLGGGFDIAISNMEYALSVYRSNWTLMLRHLKLCRDTNDVSHIQEFFTRFIELDGERFQLTPVHRIGRLLDVGSIWMLYQSLFSFVGTKNDFIIGDFGAALRALERNPAGFDRTAFVNEAFTQAEQMNSDSKPHYRFMEQLQTLGHLFESQRYTMRSLSKFAKLEEVSAVLSDMQKRAEALDAA